MPYVVMAARTGQRAPAAVGVRRIDRERQLAMTLAARLLGDVVIAGRDPQRVRVPSGREIERMPESVLCFRHVLGNKPRRRVAVVADGNTIDGSRVSTRRSDPA